VGHIAVTETNAGPWLVQHCAAWHCCVAFALFGLVLRYCDTRGWSAFI
jgi:hypothetical protein